MNLTYIPPAAIKCIVDSYFYIQFPGQWCPNSTSEGQEDNKNNNKTTKYEW